MLFNIPHLGVEAVALELDDLDGLVEHRVEEEVAFGVRVGQVDGQANRATCKTTRHLFMLSANKSHMTLFYGSNRFEAI